MNIPTSVNVGRVINALLVNSARRATKFENEKQVISAARLIFGKRISARETRTTIVVKIGKLNYLERKFIKLAKKSGETFPIKKIQLKFLRMH